MFPFLRQIASSDWHNKLYHYDGTFSQLKTNGSGLLSKMVLLLTKRKYIYVPPARKLVFSLQLTIPQCSILRYRGMKCKNWSAHAPIAMQRSTIFFLFFFFFVQRWHRTGKALYIWTAHASIKIHYCYTRSIKSKWPGLVVTYHV